MWLGIINALSVGIKRYKTFPLDLLVDLSKGPIILLIIPSIWYGIGAVGNFTVRQLFLYTAAAHFVILLPLYVSYPVAEMVRSGFLQAFLTKPVRIGSFLFFRNLGRTFVSLLSTLITFLWIYTNYGGINLHLYIIGVLLTVVFYILLGQTIGYLATWFYTIWGFQTLLVYIPSLLVGGALVPLNILPKWVVTLASFLPWKSLHYDVAMIVLGRSPNFLPLVLWILVLFLAERILFKKMLKAWESWGG